MFWDVFWAVVIATIFLAAIPYAIMGVGMIVYALMELFRGGQK